MAEEKSGEKYAGLADKRAYLQVIGSIILNPLLLDDNNRPLYREDFATEAFYKYIFVSVYNLYQQGVEKIDECTIDSYMSNYPEQYKVFQANKGLEWVSSAMSMCAPENYDYWYHRVRKFSLLRDYESKGLDTRVIFDGNRVDASEENLKFDNMTETDIVGWVESNFVIEQNTRYCSGDQMDIEMAGNGLMDLVEQFMEEPDVGLPLASPIISTLTRGCRFGCLYMRGSVQGGGKTRMAAMDACKIAVPYYWDLKEKKWVYTGISEPTVYIVTEQENAEIKTIFLACISGVNEENIKYGKYKGDELERIKQAAVYIEQSPLIQVHIPDFSIEDIKNIVKKFNREKGVRHFFFDYIFSSIKVMQNMGSKVGMGLKEHQFLLLFSNELKTICQTMDVFMFTACQLNGEVVNATIKDQNVLAGAKSLSNKLDAGMNTLPITPAEYKKIDPIIKHMIGIPRPNMATWVYKLRSSRITRVIIWSYYDLGTLRCTDLFVTDYNFNLIDVDITNIEVAEKVIDEHSVNASEVQDTQPMIQEDDEEGGEIPSKNFNW